MAEDLDDGALFSHVEICGVVSAKLNRLLKKDDLLSDLPADVTLAEVKSEIAVEYGQSITLYLNRQPLPAVKLAVVNNSTISQLRRTIEHQLGRYIERQGKDTTRVSWRYFWRKHCLVHNSQKLLDDNKTIKDYLIRNKDSLSFGKKLKMR